MKKSIKTLEVKMEDYLNKGIKEIIIQFPEIENILNGYNIGCAPCNVGTCLLKDIVRIHNLNQEEECELMDRIARIIYPDKEIMAPHIKRKTFVPASKKIEYSPPIKKLVNEHKLIKKWVNLIPKVIENLDGQVGKDKQLILDGTDFIRFYADKYHHAKEEEILFKYFDENSHILKTMHEDHESARAHVKAIMKALKTKDKNTIAEHLNAYREILTEHIKKEDEILYPWMDRNLSISQTGELFSKFNEIDEKFHNISKKYEIFITDLEEKFKT